MAAHNPLLLDSQEVVPLTVDSILNRRRQIGVWCATGVVGRASSCNWMTEATFASTTSLTMSVTAMRADVLRSQPSSAVTQQSTIHSMRRTGCGDGPVPLWTSSPARRTITFSVFSRQSRRRPTSPSRRDHKIIAVIYLPLLTGPGVCEDCSDILPWARAVASARVT